jgi:solute carrier family 25 aspartate/glutamate transporter 12/13/solute carrier family 25 carnitine/acylcarnitine transporter 20/29
VTLLQEFAVSCLSASLAHIPHHPLYTLKSQMMFYGRDFSILNFVRRTKNTRGTFLFQGLVPRTFGIAPEKALKMQAWVLVGRWVDRHVESPTITKWILAGAGAGAATTLIGESS